MDMKKHCLLLSFIIAALLCCGCYGTIESEINTLDKRIETLMSKCEKINTNIESLQTILDRVNACDFVTMVSPIYKGGTIDGYSITFKSGTSAMIMNGENAATPIIGVKKDTDGIYYWTVRYADGSEKFIYVNETNQKVMATSVRPEIKIENGNWMVSYDGEIWHDLGQATGDPGTSYFKSVADSVDYIRFTLVDNTVIDVPTWSAFEKLTQAVEAAKKGYEAVKEIIEKMAKKVYVSNVSAIYENAVHTGCRITLSDGSKYDFMDAVATNVPSIGTMRDGSNPADTAYYWSIRYPGDTTSSFILRDSLKVRSDAVQATTPLVGIDRGDDNVYYWTVSYDGGATYQWITRNGGKIRACVENIDNPVTAVKEIGSRMIQITVAGEDYLLPRYPDLEVDIPTSVEMAESDTLTVAYNIPAGDAETALMVLAGGDGFQAYLTRSDNCSGTLTIISPANFTESTSSVKLLVSDGYGSLKTVIITITYKKRTEE